MADKKDAPKADNPVLKDVEPGSDADETPVAPPHKTPPNPNAKPPKDQG